MLKNAAASLLRGRAAVSLARATVSTQQVRTIMPKKPDVNYAEISARTGLDPALYSDRTVTISKWPFCTSQSPGLRQDKWRMDFDYQDKWSNPLMGWTSVRDTLGTQTLTHMQFDSAEEAIQFAESHGMEYVVEDETEDPDINRLVEKNYGDNFRWDGDDDDGSTSHEYWACRRQGTK